MNATAPTTRRAVTRARQQRILTLIRDKLQAGRKREAARLFLDAQVHRLVPRGHLVLNWLIKNLGKGGAVELVSTFAALPCLMCRKGHAVCAACEGQAFADGGAVCLGCGGLAVIRCDFCAGSGQRAVEFIPDGLRAVVAIERTTGALDSLARLVRRKLPPIERASLNRAHAAAVRMVMAVDRQVGTIENAVVALDQLEALDERYRKRLVRAVEQAVPVARTGQHRLGQVLKHMADIAAAQGAAGLIPGDVCRQRRAYYADAAKSLRTIKLDRPFIEGCTTDDEQA